MAVLVERLVEVLNDGAPAMVLDILSPTFRDHDPLTVPGVVTPRLAGQGTRADVVELVSFLRRPDVDVRFTLEDVFGHDDRLGYRLYGDGLLHRPEADASELLPPGKLVGGSLHVAYSCVGIYRVAAGRLVERWGQAVLS